MTRHFRLSLCLITAAAIGFGIAGFGTQRLEAQNNAKAQKSAVGVVNVAELIAKSQKNVTFQADMQKRRTQLQQEAATKQKEIDLLRADLDVIPNAQERAKKENEIIKKLTEFQAWQQIQQQVMLRDQQTFLVELYDDIDKTVAKVALRDGFDLVLLDTPSPEFDRLNAEQLVNAIGNRRVIYRNAQSDITANVLAQLNADHLNRGGAE